MKKVLLLALSLMALYACEPSSVISGRKLYESYFNDILKDPKSLVIYNEEYKFRDSKKITVDWTVDYGAKNSYGGMVRQTVKFTTVGDISIYVDGIPYKLNR